MRSSYSSKAFNRATIIATVYAGTLDILSAFAYDAYDGGEPLAVLRGIAGAIIDREALGNDYVMAAIGLGLHFTIMLAMAWFYMAVASRLKPVNRVPILSGVVYGLILYGVMDWYILPWRWPTLFPILSPKDVGEQLFSHVVLVGMPIALVARGATRWRFMSDRY